MSNPFKLPTIGTNFTALNDIEDEKMTGKEYWNTVGGLLKYKEVLELMRQCKGLYRYWSCLEKAKLVQQFKGCGFVVVGACMVLSYDKRSSYGHHYNPPYEFHAWWQKQPGKGKPVIDIALPGLIGKGIETEDALGPFLTGRKPVIVAGRPPKWVAYEPHEYFI